MREPCRRSLWITRMAFYAPGPHRLGVFDSEARCHVIKSIQHRKGGREVRRRLAKPWPRFEVSRAFDPRPFRQYTEGGAQRCATGPENRADLTVKGSIPSPSANYSPCRRRQAPRSVTAGAA